MAHECPVLERVLCSLTGKLKINKKKREPAGGVTRRKRSFLWCLPQRIEHLHAHLSHLHHRPHKIKKAPAAPPNKAFFCLAWGGGSYGTFYTH